MIIYLIKYKDNGNYKFNYFFKINYRLIILICHIKAYAQKKITKVVKSY